MFLSLFKSKRVLGALDLKVEVTAGGAVGVTGVADQGNFFPLEDIVTFGNEVFEGVRVLGFGAVGVFKKNIVAVAFIPTVGA